MNGTGGALMDLRAYIALHTIDRREFAMRVGVSKESVDNYVKRKNRPREYIAAVIEYITTGDVTQRELTHPWEYPVDNDEDQSDLIPQRYRVSQNTYNLSSEEAFYYMPYKFLS